MEQKKIITIIIIIASLILALIAGFTGVKLFQLSKEGKESEVYQQGPACSGLAEISVEAEEAGSRITVSDDTPYSNIEIRVTLNDGSVIPYQEPIIENQWDWIWLVDYSKNQIDQVNFYIDVTSLGEGGTVCAYWINNEEEEDYPCELSFTVGVIVSPSPSPSLLPTSTPTSTPTPTPTPKPACWEGTCDSDDVCPSGLRCLNMDGYGRCVNPSCPEERDCICPTSTPTPVPTSPLAPTTPPQISILPTPAPVFVSTPPPAQVAILPTPAPVFVSTPPPVVQEVQLPVAGTSLPTIILSLGGILLIVLGLLL